MNNLKQSLKRLVHKHDQQAVVIFVEQLEQHSPESSCFFNYQTITLPQV